MCFQRMDIKNMTQMDVVSLDVLSFYTFCPNGCFVPRCYISGCFVSTDMLSDGRFVPPDVLSHQRFVPPDVMSQDVMSLDVFSGHLHLTDCWSGTISFSLFSKDAQFHSKCRGKQQNDSEIIFSSASCCTI
jgi:hypothetical protein